MRLTIVFNDNELTTESIRIIDSNDITFEFIQHNSTQVPVDIVDVVTNIDDVLKNMLSIRFDKKEILLNIQEYFYGIDEVESVMKRIKSKLSSLKVEDNFRIIVAKNLKGENTIAFID